MLTFILYWSKKWLSRLLFDNVFSPLVLPSKY